MATEPDPPELPTDLVYIRNPDLPKSPPGRVSREAFENHLAESGFVITDADGLVDGKEPTKKSARSSSTTTSGGASA